MKSVVFFALTVLLSFQATAQTNSKDYKSRASNLGVNKDVMKRAEALNPNNKTAVVQGRSVSRDLRFEFGANYGTVAGGGDPYLSTRALGAMVDFHINPMFSVGARYQSYDNDLSSEGKRIFDNAEKSSNSDKSKVPDLDHPVDSTMGVISFYPFYGKMNLFNTAITQFDVYMLAGYGSMTLDSGTTPTYTAGIGLGAWISQHIATRLEVRYQGYEDQISSGSRSQEWTVISGNIGILL